MKKFTIITLVLTLCMAILTIPSFAASDTSGEGYTGNELDIVNTQSEFETILELRKKTDEELVEIGLSAKEINEIKSDFLENELLRRATLTQEELKAYGYTDEQIRLLKTYDGEEITSGSQYMALSATCSGNFTSGNCSNKKIRLRYNWEWSSVPVIKMKDKVFVRWQAVKSGGVVVDATVTYAKATVKYYSITTGAYASSKDTTVNGSGGTTVDYRTFNIDMVIDDNYYWAKKGTAYITLNSEDAGYNFKYVDVGGSYGHKTVTCTIGISFPASTYSWVKFTPKLTVSQVTDNDGRIYPSGTVYNYH